MKTSQIDFAKARKKKKKQGYDPLWWMGAFVTSDDKPKLSLFEHNKL